MPRGPKARLLARLLDMEEGEGEEVLMARLVMAHDPMPGLLHAHGCRGGRVLVVGKSEDDARGVAREWGLSDAVVLEDYIAACPWIWPLQDDGRPILPDALPRVDAICVVGTPRDWGQTLQLCCDLLLNGGHLHRPAEPAAPPLLLVSNPDFDYRARPPLMRMTTGAWLHCLQALTARYGHELQPIFTGKPHRPIYEHAMALFPIMPDRVFCIGDNPASDIAGAKNFPHFRSILVLTGVAQQDDPSIPADYVRRDISEAVQLILAENAKSTL